MIFVALDFCRSPFVAFDDQADGTPAQRHRGSEIGRSARHKFLGLSDIRSNVFGWLSRTRGETGQRERCAHQLKESPASRRIVPFSCVLRKLAMNEFLKFFAIGKFLEASPVLFTGQSRIENGRRI